MKKEILADRVIVYRNAISCKNELVDALKNSKY
jgi:hypothetical protein